MGDSIQSFVQDALGITNGVFGVNGKEMLIQIISTLLLFLVIRFFFWNKVTDYLQARQEEMANEYEEAKKASEDAKSIRFDAEKELQDVRLNAKSILDDAKDRAEGERKVIVSKAKTEATKLVDDAQKEIDNNIQKARNSINEEIVSVATVMAEKIIKKEIDQNLHKDLLNEATNEVLN